MRSLSAQTPLPERQHPLQDVGAVPVRRRLREEEVGVDAHLPAENQRTARFAR